MLGLSPWIPLLAIALTALLVRVAPAFASAPVERVLNSRWAPAGAAVLSAVLSLWLWGTLSRTPVIHDESAYLLQAELFARFQWTGPGRPIPEFFEQLHVLVDGVLASKYPPGNSLILALGVLVGLPGLPILILNACASALMFVLARRVAGGVVALLTWIVWESSFPMIYYHANYMSESVSALAWLVTWWGVMRWHQGDGRRWLVATAGAVSWCMITRPVTGLALGIVALVVVGWCCRSTHRWRDLVPGAVIAAAILAIVPLWSWRTTGDFRVMPLTAYTAMYVPFDKPGFASGKDDRPSQRLPRDLLRIQNAFYREHLHHTISALPAIAWERVKMLDRDEFYEWRGGLRVFALIGLIALTLEGWIAMAAFAAQFLLYLSYAHPAWWTMYYVECMPVLAFVTALGIVRLFALLYRSEADRAAERPSALSRLTGAMALLRHGKRPVGVDTRRLVTAGVVVAAAGLMAAGGVARQVKSTLAQDHSFYDAFTQLVRQIPDRRAVVFVRYSEKHPDGLSLVRNVADLERAPLWTVYDRGDDNERLLALATDRVPYLFDEKSWTLKPMATERPQALSKTMGKPAPDSIRVRQAGRRRR